MYGHPVKSGGTSIQNLVEMLRLMMPHTHKEDMIEVPEESRAEQNSPAEGQARRLAWALLLGGGAG